MKDFFKNVLANIVAIAVICLMAGIFLVIMVTVSLASGASKVSIKDNSILALTSKTSIIESPTESDSGFFDFKSEEKKIMLYDMLKAIETAKSDDRIKGISIEADFMNAGMTQLDDIRAALDDFKKSGKFVYAYGNTVSQPSYYLGSVAQKYFLNPAGGIELKGMASQVTFFKDFADKYGIGIQVLRHGKYKSAVEPYLRNDISPENQEQLSTLLNDIWNRKSAGIAHSRRIAGGEFKTIVDSLYAILPENTLKYHLVDRLMQKSQYEAFLKRNLKLKDDDKLNRISFADYIKSGEKTTGKEEVAVLYASGNINNGDEYNDIYSEHYAKEIQKLADDEDVKAVVLRVNSPGGSANAADEILFELQQLKTKKPLIVSFGDYAASGGYYIAMAADRIYTEPNTITGSIGVFGVIPNVKGLAERNGIRSDVVKTNASSEFVSLLNGMAPGAERMLTKNIEQTYKRFVGFVTQNRKMSYDAVDRLAGGRVWSGTRAKEIGLVDQLGSLDDAVKFAAGKARLKSYSVTAYPKMKTKFEVFLNADEDEISEKILERKIGAEPAAWLKLFKNMPSSGSFMMMHSPVKVTL